VARGHHAPRLATHCDGFVAIATATDRVFVCNTVTRELAALSLGSRNAELNHGDPLLPPVALGFDRWRKTLHHWQAPFLAGGGRA
jgi:hypothetical protein